ncbi:uncharacterized protein BT62DRAFT_923503 [Guyanagaster necrorhizus]|uniref:Uncharacterized protein n=1 Tax=Guyanagaster necrorhizus TaxID=856835 RepID=A0A9P7VJ36_9AGAR|nr:uncharacterized protein BT62DRAFT_923503 [Guyanagaster necrorhizus MCA 3950]KAG7441285.1 hypothetical protein BT62DRAFT_923503 [Guyanagaster necrorhizus MCA 3950]
MKTRKKQEEQKKQEQKKKKRMSTMMRINVMMNRGMKRMMLMDHPVEAGAPKSLLVMRRIIIRDIVAIQNRGMKRMKLISHPIEAPLGQHLVTRMMDLCIIDKEKSDMENGIQMMILMGITFAFGVSTHQEMSHWGSLFKNVVNFGCIRMFQQGASHVMESISAMYCVENMARIITSISPWLMLIEQQWWDREMRWMPRSVDGPCTGWYHELTAVPLVHGPCTLVGGMSVSQYIKSMAICI